MGEKTISTPYKTKDIFTIYFFYCICNEIFCLFVCFPVSVHFKMGKKRDISEDLRQRIITTHLEGKSLRQISAIFNVSVGAIRNAIKVFI